MIQHLLQTEKNLLGAFRGTSGPLSSCRKQYVWDILDPPLNYYLPLVENFDFQCEIWKTSPPTPFKIETSHGKLSLWFLTFKLRFGKNPSSLPPPLQWNISWGTLTLDFRSGPHCKPEGNRLVSISFHPCMIQRHYDQCKELNRWRLCSTICCWSLNSLSKFGL